MGRNNGKFYDAKKTVAYFSTMKQLAKFYETRAKAVTVSYNNFSDSDAFDGGLAKAVKTFVRRALSKMLNETLEMHDYMIKLQDAVIESFETMVDPAPNARIEYNALEKIDVDFKNYYHNYCSIAADVKNLVEQIQNEFSDYESFEQPDSKTAKSRFENFCGGEAAEGGYIKECQRKFVTFDSQVCMKLKRADIVEHTDNIHDRIKNAEHSLLAIILAQAGKPAFLFTNLVMDSCKLAIEGAGKFDPEENQKVVLAGFKHGIPTVNEESRNMMSSTFLKYYDTNALNLQNLDLTNTGKFDADLEKIKQIYEENKETYLEISRQTGVPPELICAIHYRESGCNFNTYLHNGQKLGKETTIVPVGIYFAEGQFVEAAVDALNTKMKSTGITFTDDTDLATWMTFAETYNGLGYNKKGVVSPYLYSGTNAYTSGKYVSDGVYDPNAVDKQVGVYLIVTTLMED